ncbi:MAG: cell envelope integrity protein TolA [Proteobacteria bacterium]|nr:cell envelope integrity protein TolA [Pseudomonadota bacterium]
MPTTPAKLRAVAGSLAIHALIGLVLYWGLLMQTEVRNAGGQGPAIEATLISAPLRGPVAHIPHASPDKPKPQPQPKPQPPAPAPAPQPVPLQMKSQTQLPKPDTINQDEIRRNAQLAAEQARKEQDERRRQAQIDLDRKQQQLEAENRQRQMQADENAKKLAQLRAERAEAERQVKLAQQKLKQDQDMRRQLAQASAPVAAPAHPQASASNAGDTGLLGKYKQAINDQVNLSWVHTGVPEQVHCKVRFTQIPGGEVIDVKFLDCPLDAAGRDSVERAMQKAPLPYAGFESVFSRQGEVDFCYPTEKCTR